MQCIMPGGEKARLRAHGRANYGDTFGICVAGYPEAHPDVIVDDPEAMKENYWKDVHYLKEKVRAACCTV